MMAGWRARLGVLYPADGDLDRELWQFLPEGVSLHLTRTPSADEELTVEKILAEAESSALEAAARMLCTIKLDCLAYLCTAGSFIGGPGHDRKILGRLEKASGLPTTTTSTALLEALSSLQVSRLVVIAPYPAPVTERLVQFLGGNGFQVIGSYAMGIDNPTSYGGISPTELYRLAKQADQERAEAIFISCTAVQTVDVLQVLEDDLGKPVLSANQVTFWQSLNLTGVREAMPQLGRLFTLF